MKKHWHRGSLITIVTALAAAYVGTTNADTPHNAAVDAAPVRKVSYGDLNLGNRDGATALYRRIPSAAEHVCSPLYSRQLALQKHWHECMDNAVSDAVSSVNHPMLTVLANQHGIHATSTVLAAKTR